MSNLAHRLRGVVAVATATAVGAILLSAPAMARAQGGQAPGVSQGSGRPVVEAPPARQDPKTLKRDPQGHPDFSGMWNNQYTPDISKAHDGPLPFTPFGAERWQNVDTKHDPTGVCLAVGPSRLYTSPFPNYVLQTPKMIGVLFEYFTTYRMFYMDGRPHPDDLGEYAAEFNGHSIGSWQGDVLVVDTIGIDDRTWLDTAGHEHSDKLHLTERFEKLTDDNIQYSVTFDDPVFFTKPFTIVRNFTRAKDTDRILPYTCTENNKDVPHLTPNVKP